MPSKKSLTAILILTTILAAGILYAQDMQAPVVNIDPQRHGNLATAQEYIVAAAKNFLAQADAELGAAADFANANDPQPPPQQGPANASGNWTMYAANVDHPGGSTQTVRITQPAAQLGEGFKGPNQP